jgi:hypothetical protein
MCGNRWRGDGSSPGRDGILAGESRRRERVRIHLHDARHWRRTSVVRGIVERRLPDLLARSASSTVLPIHRRTSPQERGDTLGKRHDA